MVSTLRYSKVATLAPSSTVARGGSRLPAARQLPSSAWPAPVPQPSPGRAVSVVTPRPSARTTWSCPLAGAAAWSSGNSYSAGAQCLPVLLPTASHPSVLSQRPFVRLLIGPSNPPLDYVRETVRGCDRLPTGWKGLTVRGPRECTTTSGEVAHVVSSMRAEELKMIDGNLAPVLGLLPRLPGDSVLSHCGSNLSLCENRVSAALSADIAVSVQSDMTALSSRQHGAPSVRSPHGR